VNAEPTPDPDAKTAGRTRAPRNAWLRVAVAILFGLFYVYDLFEAISNTFGVTAQIAAYNETAASFGLDPVAVPWAVLVAGMLLPPVVYAGAYLTGRRWPVLRQALVFFLGLATVAALTLSLTTLAGVLAG
jgi:hypothetical protein